MHKLHLDTLFVGQNIIYLPICQSTNKTAMEVMTQSDIIEGTTVITSHQTAGRGQRGNQWEAAPHQNLTFSVILTPKFLKIQEQFNLSICVSVALHKFLQKYTNAEHLKIKWPNDLFYKDKKIGGILIENIIRQTYLDMSVIGIGLNINQTLFEESRAISLQLITRHTYSLETLLSNFLKILEEEYLCLQQKKMKTLRTYYLKHLFRVGERHFFKSKEIFEGKIIGVDLIGNIVIKTSKGQQSFGFKEVAFMY